MQLFLVQHAEALSKEEDPDRPLSPRGMGDAEAVAAFLARAGVAPGRILHSGKTRARQTADILAGPIGAESTVQESPVEIGATSPPDDLAEAARGWAGDTMVVGHMPFMGKAAARLLTGDADGAPMAFRPGSVLCLERDADTGAFALAWMIRPDVLTGA